MNDFSDEDPSWCSDNFVSHRALQSTGSVRQQLVQIMARFNIWMVRFLFDI